MTIRVHPMSNSDGMMRAARLHGVRDLRQELLPIPEPGPRDLLVRIEACGVCPTDIRKYLIGAGDGAYPLNPGHEWVGRVERAGSDVADWHTGDRVYGDTYAGYAEYALVPVDAAEWSYGPLRVDERIPLDRAVFVEPLADCIHCVHNQASVRDGDHIAVVGAGQMGLQLVAVAHAVGAHVLSVEPLESRRVLAKDLGAEEAIPPEGWPERARSWAGGEGLRAVIIAVGSPGPVEAALRSLAPGGRVVLFAGLGDQGSAVVDLNLVHYRELTIVGSEWVGAPPNSRLDCYERAHDLLASGRLKLERLVDHRCTLDALAQAFAEIHEHGALKIVVNP
jgi:L-iditol 2-dehydrogenase